MIITCLCSNLLLFCKISSNAEDCHKMENKKDIQNNRLTVVIFNVSLHWFQFRIIQLQASSET